MSKILMLAGASAIALLGSQLASAQPLRGEASLRQVPKNKVDDARNKKRRAKAQNSAVSEVTAEQPGEILVTGSRIRRTDATTAAPISILDKGMIEERGLGRLSDALSAMSQVTPLLGDRGSQDPRSGPSRVSLRNLGAGRTLTLLNGERMDNDANVIPSALIERVDILTGGASAVYGSDAIAGVVNFIVKRRFQGLEVNLEGSTQQSTNDNQFMRELLKDAGYPLPDRQVWAGQQYFGSIVAGNNFAQDRGNLSVYASYTRTVPMEMTKFDHTACPVYMNAQNPVPEYQDNKQWACGYSEFNPYHYFGTGGADWTNAKDGSGNWRPYDPEDITRVPIRDYLQRSGRRVNAGGFFTFDVTQSLKFDASLLYTHDGQEGRNALPVSFYVPEVQMPCDNPFMSTQQAQIVCGVNAGLAGSTGPFTAALFRPNYANSYQYDVDSLRLAGHLSGKIVDNIRFDTSVQRSTRTERYNGTNIFDYYASYPLWQQALQVVNYNGAPTCKAAIDGTNANCVPLNPFGLNTMTDAMWNSMVRDGGSQVKTEQLVLNGSISGTLENIGIKSPWARDGVGFAVVAEHRWNRVSEAGFGAYDWWSRYASTDSVNELGAELSLPIVQDKPLLEDLTISGAYRISDYRSLDDLAKTWKADFIYRPFAGLGFRGSLNSALRRGVLERLQQVAPYSGTFQDRCATPGPGSNVQRLSFEQCAPTGITRQQYDALAAVTGCSTAQYCNVLYRPGGNPDLKPETSRSITAGVVMQPRFLPGFTATADYYSIRIKGAFEWVRTDIISDQCFNQQVSFFCGLITRNPTTGAITDINSKYNNSGFVKTEGVDFSLYYPLTLGKNLLGFNAGRLNLGFNGTYNIADKRQFAPNTPIYSCLGYFGFFCNGPSPKFRHYASLGWDMPWKGNVSLIWRYASPTRNSKLSPEAPLASRPSATNSDTYPLIPRMPAMSLFDLSISYPITRDVDLRFNVQNMFDKDPPIVGNADAGTGAWFNTYGWYYNAWGRTLRLGIRAKLW